MPAGPGRIHYIALDRRDLAFFGIDVPVASEYDEELITIVMPVPFVPCSRLEHGPPDYMISVGGRLID